MLFRSTGMTFVGYFSPIRELVFDFFTGQADGWSYFWVGFLRTYDRTVLVGAADTFRAAAVEQLATWAERAGVGIVRPQQQGQDPAAVAFQTIEQAKRDGTEIVIIGTAICRRHCKDSQQRLLPCIRHRIAHNVRREYVE